MRRMQGLTKLVATLAIGLVLTACAGLQAGSDFYPQTDFSGYRSYVWVADSPIVEPESSRVDISPLTVRRIREAVEAELRDKGFTMGTSREQADFSVSFTVGARDMLRIEDYPSYYRGSWRWRPPYFWPNVDVSMYTEGTLAIDVFDNESRQPVWHGWARKQITGTDIENPGETIDAAVGAILADFPP